MKKYNIFSLLFLAVLFLVSPVVQAEENCDYTSSRVLKNLSVWVPVGTGIAGLIATGAQTFLTGIGEMPSSDFVIGIGITTLAVGALETVLIPVLTSQAELALENARKNCKDPSLEVRVFPIEVNDLLVWSGHTENQGSKKTHQINECVTRLNLKLRNGSHDDWPNRDWNIITGGRISSISQKLVFGNDDNSNEVEVNLETNESVVGEGCIFVKSISVQPIDSSSGSGGGDFSVSYAYR